MPPWTDNTPVGNPIPRDLMGAITTVMAGSLLVFLRRDIGVRLLRRRYFLFAAALMIGFSFYERPIDRPLIWFTATVVVFVFAHHFRHMRRIKRGNPQWHTYDTGKSLISAVLPLPKPLVQIIIEPALCGALGWWLAGRSYATFYLGSFLWISAGLLFIVETKIHFARRRALLDLGDTVVESLHFARRAENFTQSTKASARAARNSARALVWRTRLGSLKAAARDVWMSMRRPQKETSAANDGKRTETAPVPSREPIADQMTPQQALDLLQLKPGASAAEIRAAYNHLMQKGRSHAGRPLLADKLNRARDTLLKPHTTSV